MDNVVLPDGLLSLTFGSCFNQSLDFFCFAKRIAELELGQYVQSEHGEGRLAQLISEPYL